MLVTIDEMQYRVHSPSLLELIGYPVQVVLGTDRRWYIWLSEKPGPSSYDNRAAATEAVAKAFKTAGVESNLSKV